MDFNRILVGVDGSEAAGAALRWAREALARDGEIVALYATGAALVGQAAVSTASGLGVFRNLGGSKEDAYRALDAWCEPLRAWGVSYRTVVSDDEPVDALLDSARREDADVIVVGHQGTNRFLARFFQGLGEQLIDHAKRPVVVVPSHPAADTES